MTELRPVNANQNLDLEAYFERIDYGGPRKPNLETLKALQAAHLTHIPFENVDVLLRRPVRLDLESLQAKIVGTRRGGYCFEQNTLFSAVLQELGFDVRTLEARVRPVGETETLPRTHMVLRVLIDSGSWLADVGFGGDGSFEPISFDGRTSEQTVGSYRIVQESDETWVLQRQWRGEGRDLYSFGLSPALPVDYVVANHFTSTHPESIFLRVLTVQRSLAQERHILRGLTYILRQGSEQTEREIGREELPMLLRDLFGLELTEEEVFEALDQNS